MRKGLSFHDVTDLIARDGYACVRCGKPIQGKRGVDWSVQHRRPRGMGGSRKLDTHSPVNLIMLCGSATTGCHGHVESHRAEALSRGWLLHQADDPALVPVLIEHEARWVYLTADCTYSDKKPEGVA